ncbi:MAG TPA: hypothetical protein VJ553_06530 [Candidatus Paceibacterota bacterium]|nr:MAG: hypothetical protein A2Y74_05585 [Actinobacteria bacterium RBG_13_63_9]HXK37209.1 hypothetical protein [Candidatus Paceibacterota bacterium]
MIVLFRSYGNHSNRLFQNIHLEAFCLEHGIDYANPTLSDLCPYYVDPARPDHQGMARILRSKPVAALRRAGLLSHVITFDHESDNAALLLSRHKGKALYVDGWGFRVFPLTEKYQDRLVAKYALKEDYLRENDALRAMGKIDRDQYVVVAVHIRRSDYRYWRNGAYYFSDEVYRSYMTSMESVVGKQLNKNVVFVIFSDERTSFAEAANLVLSENPWYVDHYLMGQCDYIIGPPSTFTLWASYAGRTRYLHITDASGHIDVSQFDYCRG